MSLQVKTQTVERLKEFALMWKDGKLPAAMSNLYIEGVPGSGKTHTIREVTSDVRKCKWLGSSSPFEFYKQLYEVRDADLVVLDDPDSIIRKPDGLRLLKEAMGKAPSTVHWHTNRTGPGKDYPSQFQFRARMCVITNDIGNTNHHTRAVRSRSVLLQHIPETEQVMKYALDNGIISQEVYDMLRDVWPPPQYTNLRELAFYQAMHDDSKEWIDIYKEGRNDH